jgi:hypothetical protein
MSWRSVPELGPCHEGCKMQVSEPPATLSETPTVSRSSWPVCKMEVLTKLQSGTILPPSTGNPGVDAFILSLPAIPVSPLAMRVSGVERKTSAISGPMCAASFARFDHSTSSWRMFQASLWELDSDLHTSPRYLATWPDVGMMRNGVCYRLHTLVPRTYVKESSLLRTPTKADGRQFYALSLRAAKKRIQAGRQIAWIHQAIIYKQWKSAFANPRFSEAMMGLPTGWSDLKPLAKPLFAKLPLLLDDVL